METLSDIPLRKIFHQITFDDLINLLKTPEFRNIVKSFFSEEINFRELEKRIVLECIDQLEKSIQTNLFFELIEFFQSKGYRDLRTLPEFKTIISKAYQDVLNLGFNSNIKQMILKLINDNGEIFDLVSLLKRKNVLNQSIKYLLNTFQENLDAIEDNEIKRFKKSFFKGPNSYDNTKEYLEAIQEYLDEYFEGDVQTKNTFNKCIDKRLEFINKFLR